MILQVDIGNTRIKWRARLEGVTLASGSAGHGDYAWLKSIAMPECVWAGSVVPSESERLRQALAEGGGPAPQFACAEVAHGELVSGYSKPLSLGVDRWLALLGARQLSREPTLVVDAGTAMTVDLLTASGQHLGGYIGPGFSLMQTALARQSAALSVAVAANVPRREPGRSSAKAIESALLAMGCGLLESAYQSLAETERSVDILFTGGDGDFWREAFARGGCYQPDLVFIGLEAYFASANK